MIKMFSKAITKSDDASVTDTVEQRSDQDAILPSYKAAIAAPGTADFQNGASGDAYVDSCYSASIMISKDVWEKIGRPPITGTREMDHAGGSSRFAVTSVDLNMAGLTLMGVEALIDETASQMVLVGRKILNYYVMTMDRHSVQLTPNLNKVATLDSYRPKVTLLKVY